MEKTWQKLKNHPHLFKQYLLREKVIAAIREFFVQKGFHEIEVPQLTPALPAESYVEVFETILLNRKREKKQAFLTTSPEMFLKKLLVAGIGNCFSICKSFRNTEDLSKLHNPEFTILEWYRINANYQVLIGEVEQLFLHLFKKIYQKPKPLLIYQKQVIDLSPPWERLSMTQAFIKYANIDLLKNLDLKTIKATAKKKRYAYTTKTTWEELFHQIYLNEVAPQFPKDRPTIIYDYPVQLAALAAKPKVNDPRFVERFEVYIGGIELADCCTELTDVKEQQKRFQKELDLRKKLGKNDYPVDQEFIEALKLRLPPCAGIALGVDRLVMLFTDAPRIQDVLFFPASELWADEPMV